MALISQLWHWLWFAHTGFHASLFALLIWRRFYKQFPGFVAYVGFASLQTTALLVMNYSPFVSGDQYYVVYVATTGILAALSFAVVYELLGHVLSEYPLLHNLGTRFFCWTTTGLIVVAIALAWLAPASGGDRVMSVIFVLRRTVDLLLCGLLLLLFIFPRYFNLSWRSHTFGIALGLGILASAELGAYAIRSQIEPVTRNLSEDVLELVTQAATLFSVLVWTAYVLAPERKSQPRSSLPAHDLETWNQELQRLLQQ